jgi:anti-anti-sigma regulatory factor
VKIEIKKIDGVDVVYLPAHVDRSDYEVLRDLIAGMINSGQMTVMVECRSAERIPSVALGVFCSLGSMMHARGGVLGLVGLSGHTRRLVQEISMDRYVAMFDCLEEAVERCSEKV